MSGGPWIFGGVGVGQLHAAADNAQEARCDDGSGMRDQMIRRLCDGVWSRYSYADFKRRSSATPRVSVFTLSRVDGSEAALSLTPTYTFWLSGPHIKAMPWGEDTSALEAGGWLQITPQEAWAIMHPGEPFEKTGYCLPAHCDSLAP